MLLGRMINSFFVTFFSTAGEENLLQLAVILRLRPCFSFLLGIHLSEPINSLEWQDITRP